MDPTNNINTNTLNFNPLILWVGIFLIFLLAGCDLLSSDDDDNPTRTNNNINAGNTSNWLIPRDEVVDGGPGPDGIPSVDNPEFAPVDQIEYVENDRLVVGIKVGDEVRAYPHQILDWHEIVNDKVGDEFISLTYCPLTGTGIGWDRKVDGAVTEFGVSGLLFRNNLIPYDRNSGSRWSQMQLRGVSGELAGKNIRTVKVIETTWKTWKDLYPKSEVLTRNTGFSRNYQGFAYGSSYSVNDDQILFPVQNKDDRLNNKDRVLGIISENVADESAIVRVYPLEEFGTGINLVRDHLNGQEFIIAGSSNLNFATAFKAVLEDGTWPEFEPVEDELPVILKDEEGNRWDIFGYAVEGPRKGEKLAHIKSYTGYWFAWADFFPGLEIYDFE